MSARLLIPLVASFAVATIATGVALPLLRKHILDHPNARSSHGRATPRAGGLAILLGITVGTYLLTPETDGIPAPALLAVLVLAATGLWDDIRSLNVRLRLLIQLVCGTVIAGALLSPSSPLDIVIWGLSSIFVAGFVNAFNFMDGSNGLASLSATVAGGWYAYVGVGATAESTVTAGLAILGACLGFLCWNITGRVFMGDVGSYLLGALMSLLAIQAWILTGSWLTAGAPLLITIADTATTTAKRALAGKSITEAHRTHVYQRMIDSGLSHSQMAILSAAMSLAVCLASLAPPAIAVCSWIVLLAAYLQMPRLHTSRKRSSA